MKLEWKLDAHQNSPHNQYAVGTYAGWWILVYEPQNKPKFPWRLSPSGQLGKPNQINMSYWKDEKSAKAYAESVEKTLRLIKRKSSES